VSEAGLQEPTGKNKTKQKRLVRDKHVSLFLFGVFEEKQFNNIDTCSEAGTFVLGPIYL
jgi:hypothetical protein